MNPDHLTPEVKEQVVKAYEAYLLLQKEKRDAGISNLWDTQQESEEWINPFYNPVSHILKLEEFSEFLFLEVKSGFVSGYIGGATFNPGKDTVIKIG